MQSHNQVKLDLSQLLDLKQNSTLIRPLPFAIKIFYKITYLFKNIKLNVLFKYR